MIIKRKQVLFANPDDQLENPKICPNSCKWLTVTRTHQLGALGVGESCGGGADRTNATPRSRPNREGTPRHVINTAHTFCNLTTQAKKIGIYIIPSIMLIGFTHLSMMPTSSLPNLPKVLSREFPMMNSTTLDIGRRRDLTYRCSSDEGVFLGHRV